MVLYYIPITYIVFCSLRCYCNPLGDDHIVLLSRNYVLLTTIEKEKNLCVYGSDALVGTCVVIGKSLNFLNSYLFGGSHAYKITRKLIADQIEIFSRAS